MKCNFGFKLFTFTATDAEAVIADDAACRVEEDAKPDSIIIGNNNKVVQIVGVATLSTLQQKGWGAHCLQQQTGGRWSSEEQGNHINYLELLAAFLALKSFAKTRHHCHIMLRLDNTHRSGIHQEERRDSYSKPFKSSSNDVEMVHGSINHFDSIPCSRSGERDSRLQFWSVQ